MARFLFATWEGGGHVQPLLLVAQALVRRGHTALVASDACNAADAAALGLPFQPWTSAPSRTERSPDSDPVQDWRATSPQEVIGRVVDGVMCGPALAYARDARRMIEGFGPDVVVTQELLFGVMAAAEAARTRLAVFASNLWPLPTLDGAPPFGAGAPPAADEGQRTFYRRVASHAEKAFQRGGTGLNRARASIGLPALDDVFGQLDAARAILIATSRAFDYDFELPRPYRYVGPYLADPAWTRPWRAPFAPDDARPLALVSFSTMYQGQESLLRRVIAALGALKVRGVVLLGPALRAEDFPAQGDVAVAERAPLGALLPEASIVVTHGGHATVLRPLMAGVPLVCLPQGRDQLDNAARVAERGAGLRLHPDAPAEAIAAAVSRVLSERSFAHAARSLGDRIVADCARRSAEAELEAVAA